MLEVLAAVATQGRHERSLYFLSEELPHLLGEQARAEPPGVLVDLGAGEGSILYALESAGLIGERAYAVDLSARSLAIAATISDKVVPVVADVVDAAAIADGAADAVVSSQTIEHLPDDRALVDEIARVLRPGGWFYVSTVLRGRRAWWFRRGPLGWQIDPTHVREYTSEADFAAALEHPLLVIERVVSRPLRFPVSDALLRLLPGPLRRADAYERSSLLAATRHRTRVRVPGYRWVEAIGRRESPS
jgi:SAM-dependent methyltransferase